MDDDFKNPEEHEDAPEGTLMDEDTEEDEDDELDGFHDVDEESEEENNF